MPPALIDTDILSEILKAKNAHVTQTAIRYLQQHGQFAFSAITRYEILRGLKSKNATAQLQKFEAFCLNSLVLPVRDAILVRAADLWVVAFQGGHPRNDADLIIASTALEGGRVLVSGNAKHFTWISGLTVEDWRQP
jgi:predicted nucleic acid-binding protein